jgi:nucleoid-associated protein EbfC
MKDMGGLMRQAQAMQAKLGEAQARAAELEAEGTAGGGAVVVTLKGTGELVKVVIDEEAMQPGEGEVLADLIVAAHADAKKKVDAKSAELIRQAAGPMAGMLGGALPGFKL